MKRIYDWAARPQTRNFTAGDMIQNKGQMKLVQTTANSEEEAAAASDAGLDLVMGNCEHASEVRAGAPHLFYTAAVAMPTYPTEEDILRAAFKAMEAGADSIYTARGPHIVEMLALEGIPVMCHLGLVPRRSTWRGGLRAIGKTKEEALALYQDFKTMEDAGAFSVEAEVICAPVMAEITKRTSLITSSLGSGDDADIIYLFQNDICGEQKETPRHAKKFGDLHRLTQMIAQERRAALSDFAKAARSGAFPEAAQTAGMDGAELEGFLDLLEKG